MNVREIWNHPGIGVMYGHAELEERIAAALAAERQRVLAPVLAVCADYDEGRSWSASAVDRIRTLAEEASA